jgi:hypothetical protein
MRIRELSLHSFGSSKVAREFEEVAPLLNFVRGGDGRPEGAVCTSQDGNVASVASDRNGQGGPMLDRRNFSPNASANVKISALRAAGDPTREGRLASPSG